jgi:hypothetical protein
MMATVRVSPKHFEHRSENRVTLSRPRPGVRGSLRSVLANELALVELRHNRIFDVGLGDCSVCHFGLVGAVSFKGGISKVRMVSVAIAI